MTMRSILRAGLVAVLLPLAATAAEPGAPDVNELVRSLAPITQLPEHGGPPRRAVELAVEFEFGSARLTEGARRLLDRLGTALGDARLAGSRFEIVGHTDAAGSRAANQALSEQRAAAVRAYLVERHRIEPGRLAVLGRGEAALKNPLDPLSGINRRVEVVNLTPYRPAEAGRIERKAKDILTGK